MPDIKTVIVEEEDPYGTLWSEKCKGGSYGPVVAAICNAVYDAVEVRITRLPVTSEFLLY
jgi:CO/xanthine dehydrogenase Mo-binding subunit